MPQGPSPPGVMFQSHLQRAYIVNLAVENTFKLELVLILRICGCCFPRRCCGTVAHVARCIKAAHYSGINIAHNPQQLAAAAAAAVAAIPNAGFQHRGAAQVGHGHGFTGTGSKVLLVNNLHDGVSA